MSEIKLVSVGIVKEKHYLAIQQDFIKRISFYHKLNLNEIKEVAHNEYDHDKYFSRLSGEMNNKINSSDFVIVMDKDGKEITSPKLATLLERLFMESKKPLFLTGGSLGVPSDIKTRANKIISFGRVTFPHKLFRMMLLEQIYRALSISNNGKYHK